MKLTQYIHLSLFGANKWSSLHNFISSFKFINGKLKYELIDTEDLLIDLSFRKYSAVLANECPISLGKGKLTLIFVPVGVHFKKIRTYSAEISGYTTGKSWN